MTATEAARPTPTEELQLLTDHVRTHGARYLGSETATDVNVRHIATDSRPASRLHRFVVADSIRELRLIAKVALPRGPRSSTRPRPRLVTPATFDEKSGMEFATIRAVDQAFGSLRPDGLGALRALDHLPALGAILVVEEDAMAVRSLVRRGYRARTPRGRAVEALERAGAWLRMFGRVEVPHARPRLTDRQEVAAQFERFAAYIARRSHAGERAPSVFERAATLARTVLPEEIPLALAHGDFAPRNVLVDDAGRVIVIDTLGRWRTSPLEDLAYAIVAMTASPSVLLLAPAATLAWPLRCGEALLRGYFGSEPIPRRELALYQALVLADRWASTIDGRSAGPQRRLSWRIYDAAYLRRMASHVRAAE